MHIRGHARVLPNASAQPWLRCRFGARVRSALIGQRIVAGGRFSFPSRNIPRQPKIQHPRPPILAHQYIIRLGDARQNCGLNALGWLERINSGSSELGPAR